LSYEYYYENGEANFGPPLAREADGGAHFTFDVILHDWRSVYGLRRPDGLHDGPKNALYFPHGLIRFGETVTDAVRRLASEQAGADVQSVEIYNLPSWVENNHWHLCLNVFALISSPPAGSDEVSEVVRVDAPAAADDFAWWTEEQLESMLNELRLRAAIRDRDT